MAAEYNPFDAAAVAHAHLPDTIRAALTPDDVLTILRFEYHFHQTNGFQTVAARDLEVMIAYIGGVAAEQGQLYSVEQIAHVLKGEDAYLRHIGLIDP